MLIAKIQIKTDWNCYCSIQCWITRDTTFDLLYDWCLKIISIEIWKRDLFVWLNGKRINSVVYICSSADRGLFTRFLKVNVQNFCYILIKLEVKITLRIVDNLNCPISVCISIHWWWLCCVGKFLGKISITQHSIILAHIHISEAKCSRCPEIQLQLEQSHWHIINRVELLCNCVSFIESQMLFILFSYCLKILLSLFKQVFPFINIPSIRSCNRKQNSQKITMINLMSFLIDTLCVIFQTFSACYSIKRVIFSLIVRKISIS